MNEIQRYKRKYIHEKSKLERISAQIYIISLLLKVPCDTQFLGNSAVFSTAILRAEILYRCVRVRCRTPSYCKKQQFNIIHVSFGVAKCLTHLQHLCLIRNNKQDQASDSSRRKIDAIEYLDIFGQYIALWPLSPQV